MYPLFFRGQDLGRGLRFTAALFTALWNVVSIRSGAAIDSMARETSANRHFSDSTTYTNSGGDRESPEYQETMQRQHTQYMLVAVSDRRPPGTLAGRLW